MTDRQLRLGQGAGPGTGAAPQAGGMAPGKTTLVDQLAARQGDGSPPVTSGIVQMQQATPSAPVDPGATGWGKDDLSPAYKTPRTANYQDTEAKRGPAVEDFRKQVDGDPDKLAAASELAPGSTKITSIHLEPADIYFIVGQHVDDIGKGREAQVQVYLDRMCEAFRIMKIDTVEAMAMYIAHSAGETMFAYLTEGQVKDELSGKNQTPDDKRQAFLDDPDKLHESRDPNGPLRYTNKQDQAHYTVDPANQINAASNPTYKDTFIGRGPVQVTHDYEYVKCLVVLEEMAKTATPADRALIDEAVKAIKLDPRQAANPKYSFLFSAAFMHESGGTKSAASVGAAPTFSGKDAASSWVAGGGFDIYANYDKATAALAAAKQSGDQAAIAKAQTQFNEWKGHRSRAKIKSEAYGRAVQRIKEVVAKQSGGAAQPGAAAAPASDGGGAAPSPLPGVHDRK